ncbi:EF-hand domain-containing protein [Sandaracinobacteroides hominis]|uniref:hypothetical protein n=1 Tax=Sandaracinobacteroides hominis TaxID=2780086 RepID=UPI0018F5C264|nr:hypothetical protein [Sandaracinobacteroides hominis]
MIRIAVLAALVAAPVAAAAPQIEGAQAPSASGTHLFIAPSGEPFRAGLDEPYPVAKWFAGADADGDGKLTLAEFVADGDRWFKALDSSRNGVLEAAEIDAYEAAVLAPLTGRPGMGAPAAGAGAGGPPPGGGRPKRGEAPPRGAGAYGLIDIPHPIKAADQDMNSRVTPGEYHKVMTSRFEMLDLAAAEKRAKAKKGSALPTGELLLAELPKGRAQLQAEKQAQERAESATKRR